jgi:hypothetical protein
MSKIRKGSIVWDMKAKEKVKVLNNPYKGELPDGLFRNTGTKCHKLFVGTACISKNEEGINNYHTFNNQPCEFRSVHLLIPYSEYLRSTVFSDIHDTFKSIKT